VISRLRGKPVARRPDGLVLDVNGVGYLVAATPSALRRADGADEISLETYLHVREDALQLYGFADAAERELFEHLLSVSGVGPKVALAIVSGSSPAELRRAIALDDTARFEAIPGIGKKTAQRVVLELKEKVGLGTIVEAGAPGDHLAARDALVELGYTLVDAERALAEVDPELAPEERVRLALRRAARRASCSSRSSRRATRISRYGRAASTSSSGRSA
jgi:Holliday junction DNA helicase RuvA